jgi:hypothetical protein
MDKAIKILAIVPSDIQSQAAISNAIGQILLLVEKIDSEVEQLRTASSSLAEFQDEVLSRLEMDSERRALTDKRKKLCELLEELSFRYRQLNTEVLRMAS